MPSPSKEKTEDCRYHSLQHAKEELRLQEDVTGKAEVSTKTAGEFLGQGRSGKA